jgi:hypothetical protein
MPLRRSLLIGLCFGLALPAVAWAGPADPAPEALLAGTWTLVSVDNLLPDGRRVPLYGSEPRGRLMFDAAGRYAVQILRSDRPRFAAGDQRHGTAEENRAAVAGYNAHFGRFSVDPARGTLTFRIEHASFPNWEGTEQVRSYRLTGDDLIYRVPTPTTGGPGAIGEVHWRRIEVGELR